MRIRGPIGICHVEIHSGICMPKIIRIGCSFTLLLLKIMNALNVSINLLSATTFYFVAELEALMTRVYVLRLHEGKKCFKGLYLNSYRIGRTGIIWRTVPDRRSGNLKALFANFASRGYFEQVST
jgi:hypothetical protein